jgi:putative oxidoreductase
MIRRCLAGKSFHDHDVWLFALSGMAGVFLLAGLWTPVVAALSSLLEIGIAIQTAADPSADLLTAVICAALTVLGPGSWSVDARLFGRRRISIDAR